MARLQGAILLVIIALAGCATQRPVDTVRERGDWHYKRGDYAAAAMEYREVTERYPGDWPAQHQLGLCLIETGDYTGARRALEIAHDRRPNDPAIADALAEAMYRQGDEPHLYTFLREQTERHGDVRAYLRMGMYTARLNDPDSAKVAIETAIMLDNGQTVTPYLAAADLAERLGDLEGAVRYLRQAYGIDPYNDKINDRLRALGEVPGPTLAMPPGRNDPE
jgi:Flp pilus assembly protein TadD